jgi:hypothetical protein
MDTSKDVWISVSMWLIPEVELSCLVSEWREGAREKERVRRKATDLTGRTKRLKELGCLSKQFTFILWNLGSK